MKHYNGGNVWGRVAECKLQKSESGTPYLSIQVECPNETYGNVKTYGRLWGKDKTEAFLSYHKAHPGSAYRFRGFFSQYSKNGATYSNYTFFEWQPIDGTEFRAAFVLTGEVVENLVDSLVLRVIRQGGEGYDDIQEEFSVHALNDQDFRGLKAEDTVQVKGTLRSKEGEDYFGSPSGEIRPYVADIKQCTSECGAF